MSETTPNDIVDTGADEAAGEGTQFTPKVQVSEIEVKTLEEDEIVCFKARSKLYVFVAEDVYGGEVRKNFWKERGTGDVKLLRHKELGKVRLLMRQEKTLKICANHLISPFVEMKENVGSDRSWIFTAADFADEELKTETFAIKFGTAETAKAYKEAIELAKQVNGEKIDPSELKAIAEDDDDDDKPAKTSSEPPKAPSGEEIKDIDKQIEERNKREELRRDSVRLQSAVEDSDHDSQAEDINEMMSKVALVGGYNDADVDNEEVQKAAKFAVMALDKGDLVKVVEAAQQVVAGMNYRVILHIKHADSTTHSYLCRVFKPLPSANQPMSLEESVHHGPVEA